MTAADRPPWGALALLGLGQILNWGTLYYVIAVLGARMAGDLGIPTSAVFAAYSGGLAISGLVAPAVGRLIDARGGRFVLSSGSLAGALAFTILALAEAPILHTLGWLVAGAAMAFALYDPAFATVAQLFPRDFRRALTALTLLGGLASTVFWPVAYFLGEALGWRATLGVCALAHLVIGWPLHRFGLPAWRPPAAPEHRDAAPPAAKPPGFALLAGGLALTQFIASALGAHVINLLAAGGIATATAVGLATLIGPMQVLGRIVEFSFSGRIAATAVGAIAIGLMLAAMVLIGAAGSSVALGALAMIVYGWGNGTITIARGTVPAELFGRERYGALLGGLARPQFVARAVAPAAVAFVLAASSARMTCALLAATMLAAAIAYALALRRMRMNRA